MDDKTWVKTDGDGVQMVKIFRYQDQGWGKCKKDKHNIQLWIPSDEHRIEFLTNSFVLVCQILHDTPGPHSLFLCFPFKRLPSHDISNPFTHIMCWIKYIVEMDRLSRKSHFP